MRSSTNRRQFLKQSLGAATAPMILGSAEAARVFGANERVQIAVAGLNGRGNSHIGAWMGNKHADIVYMVDPDENVLNKKVAAAGDRFKGKGIKDIRQALEDKEVDAISIATPNHWHSLMTIWGAQAGKHVYVEKPMSHDVYEGRVAVAAQKKYGVVIQHGTQRRSEQKHAALSHAIKAGKFGRLK
ncbi:MAG: Gfo/Idh/MocA family oxidoreductase, partial [Verrucomicrobiota bacterium]